MEVLGGRFHSGSVKVCFDIEIQDLVRCTRKAEVLAAQSFGSCTPLYSYRPGYACSKIR